MTAAPVRMPALVLARGWASIAAAAATAMAMLASGRSVLAADAPVRVPDAMQIAVGHLGGAAPPIIDGDISDTGWQSATHFSDFHQVRPQPLAAVSERTEAWVMQDNYRLYVAFYCHDSQPGQITSTTRARDVPLRDSDMVRVMLDPHGTHREGYAFELNPDGARLDALVQAAAAGGPPGSSLVLNWNMIWEGRARRVADGWTAEFAIPFRGLSFDPGQSTWVMDLGRQVKRLGEYQRSSPTPAAISANDISYAGTLTGLADMSQGRGLDVQGYLLGRVTRDWAGNSTGSGLSGSLTAYYKLSSALTGLLTLRPDFSDAPLDARQVNTTRFSLFEPETREFFLEDAGNFEFGNQLLSDNGRPFFSRNIGLVDGQPIDVDAGAKLSGDIGHLHVGALVVRTGSAAAIRPQTLAVARVAREILTDSRIGAIVTSGDPTGASSNRVAGADFQLRTSTYRGDRRVTLSGYLERSFSGLYGNDDALGLGFSYPNEPQSFDFTFQQIGTNFNPALGFVNRPGIRSYDASTKHVWRPLASRARVVSASGGLFAITGLDGSEQASDTWLQGDLELSSNGTMNMSVRRRTEVLPEAFPLPGQAILPAGRSVWYRGSANLASSNLRKLSASVGYGCCRFYDGALHNITASVLYRPSPFFSTELNWEQQLIELPSGRSDIQISSLTADLAFNAELRIDAQLQYDTASQQFAAAIRYRWQPRPTTELFIALGESAGITGPLRNPYYQSDGTTLVVRFGHRLQY